MLVSSSKGVSLFAYLLKKRVETKDWNKSDPWSIPFIGWPLHCRSAVIGGVSPYISLIVSTSFGGFSLKTLWTGKRTNIYLSNMTPTIRKRKYLWFTQIFQVFTFISFHPSSLEVGFLFFVFWAAVTLNGIGSYVLKERRSHSLPRQKGEDYRKVSEAQFITHRPAFGRTPGCSARRSSDGK